MKCFQSNTELKSHSLQLQWGHEESSWKGFVFTFHTLAPRRTGMLEGSWGSITHLQGTEQACNPCLKSSPIDGFQFLCEAAAFVFRRKAGFWAQGESRSLPAVSWAMTLCVCTCCSLCGGTEIFQLMEDWANRVYSGLFSQDWCFSSGQWVKPWSLVHNQFVLLSVPSGKAFWNVPASEYSLALTWRSKMSCLRTSTAFCPPI